MGNEYLSLPLAAVRAELAYCLLITLGPPGLARWRGGRSLSRASLQRLLKSGCSVPGARIGFSSLVWVSTGKNLCLMDLEEEEKGRRRVEAMAPASF